MGDRIITQDGVLVRGSESTLELVLTVHGSLLEELSLSVIDLLYEEDGDLGLNLVGLGLLVLR